MSAQWFGNLHDVPYNSLSSALELRQSVISTNEGHRLRDAGAMDEAEERLKQALAAKQAYPGPANVSAAISHDNLGRVQLQMGKLDEAEANFRKALEIRKDMKGEEWDNAVTRENLAQVLEAKGNLEGAKEVRLSYGDKSVCCANYKCPIQQKYLPTLKKCSTCKCVYYCSAECQTQDWKDRHKTLCRPVN